GLGKGGLAVIIGVSGAAIAQGAAGRLDDVSRRRRVGLTAHQRDEGASLLLESARLGHHRVDGGWPQPADPARKRWAVHPGGSRFPASVSRTSPTPPLPIPSP